MYSCLECLLTYWGVFIVLAVNSDPHAIVFISRNRIEGSSPCYDAYFVWEQGTEIGRTFLVIKVGFLAASSDLRTTGKQVD